MFSPSPLAANFMDFPNDKAFDAWFDESNNHNQHHHPYQQQQHQQQQQLAHSSQQQHPQQQQFNQYNNLFDMDFFNHAGNNNHNNQHNPNAHDFNPFNQQPTQYHHHNLRRPSFIPTLTGHHHHYASIKPEATSTTNQTQQSQQQLNQFSITRTLQNYNANYTAAPTPQAVVPSSSNNNANAFHQAQVRQVLNLKTRINSWTSQEEAFLIGCVVAKYLSQGSLFGSDINPVTPSKKRKRGDSETTGDVTDTTVPVPLKGSSKSAAIENCWESIKQAFDTVWDNYTTRTGYIRQCDRTAQALARHYKVMKTKLKSGQQQDFHRLYSSWRNDYDVNHCLLHQDFFAIQEHIKKQAASTSKDEPEVESKDEDGNEIDENSVNVFGSGSVGAGGDHFQRVNSWNPHEEVILVGVVVDRFISRGSLVSPRKLAKNSNSDEDHDCWSTIKRTYDLAWVRFTDISGIERPMERTVNALSRHYKVMRSRIIRNTKMQLSAGADAPKSLTLSQIYDNWVTAYNKDYVLVQPGESN